MNKQLILVVDDDSISRHLITGFLKNEKKYTVKTVESAQDCLSFTEKNNVDLIISDVEMENLNGLELCEILLSNKKTSSTPVILSSIRDQRDINRKSRNYTNVKKVVQKPYCQQQLLSDIEELLAA